MKKLKLSILFIVALLFAFVPKFSMAFQQEEQTEETGDVLLKPIPQNKNAIFKGSDPIVYKLQLHNNTNEVQNGRVSYTITTDEGEKAGFDSIHVNLKGNGFKELLIKIPPKNTGFYRINFMVNLPEYDDTVRKVFGVNPEQITSQLHKPADFDEFWKHSHEQLEKVVPQYRVLERRDLSTDEKKVYSVEMRSFGNLLIRGWLVIPRDGKRFPVHYRVPGYVVTLKPNMDNDDFIAFDLNVRGNGNSKDVVNIGTDNYCLINIENKDKYIYRGVYMDCLRGVDFLCSHANLGIDTNKIYVEGGSQGGSLALITAALDKRVKVLTMQVPLYADIHDNMNISASYDKQVFPFKVFRKYLGQHSGFTWEKFYNTFDYFDPQNFAPMVHCPVLMGIGLLDQFCPPRCSMALYNHISSTNKEFVCVPNSTHEVDFNYFMFQNLWIREKFRIP
ncbi:acetylxylan esterase [Mucilaginibacter sp.]|uniref:acetylxylan esterase n=1 Tax=Mucilaginibacter sp. TaxID=1882438 RepID=UPI003D117708